MRVASPAMSAAAPGTAVTEAQVVLAPQAGSLTAIFPGQRTLEPEAAPAVVDLLERIGVVAR